MPEHVSFCASDAELNRILTLALTQMRIMFLEPKPDHGGGLEQVSLATAQYLAMRGHTIFLLHDSDGSMLPAYTNIVAKRFQIPLPGFARRRPVATFTAIRNIGYLARNHQIDLIFSSHLGSIPVAGCVSALYGTPFCFHLGLMCSHDWMRPRFAVARIAGGIAPSIHCAESWQLGGWPQDRLHVIPNWVDTRRFQPADDPSSVRQELGLPLNANMIVFVGRVRREKGIGELVKAFAAIAEGRPNCYLVIVGRIEAHFAREFRELIDGQSASARDRIIVRPATDVPEKYFAAADLVAVLSLNEETFGLTLIEAMATGAPIVATRIKSFEQILDGFDNDIFVSPGDVNALRERLIWWLDHPAARTKLACALRRRCLERFTESNCASRYEALLEQIMAAGVRSK